MNILAICALGLFAAIAPMIHLRTLGPDDKKILADLDTEYQLAVKNNDFKTMDRIMHDDFALVLGDGRSFNKADLLKLARDKTIIWERQEDSMQTVRVWGDTATVTALLWEKGSRGGKVAEKKLWFTDVYIRTPEGWKYVFGQASLPLPD